MVSSEGDNAQATISQFQGEEGRSFRKIMAHNYSAQLTFKLKVEAVKYVGASSRWRDLSESDRQIVLASFKRASSNITRAGIETLKRIVESFYTFK